DLELLRFGESRIDDSALARVGVWPKLRSLILQRAPITDAGLPALYGPSRLESLYLEGTEVTETGIARLQQKLPKLHIHPHP
ncbi:MAG TPA: transcriptional regulator, partial [Pirellulales bacterium]|nr:transcriptional regulator [Pirellulales bacterium]